MTKITVLKQTLFHRTYKFLMTYARISEFIFLTFSFCVYYRQVFVTHGKFQPYFDMLKGAQRNLSCTSYHRQ